MTYRTVADMNARQAQGWQHPNPAYRPTYTEPTDDERLFTSARVAEGCLTHLTRWVVTVPIHRYKIGQAWCGSSHVARFVPLADEAFGCGRCIERAERYGLPTYRLIPSTGCEVSEGRRGLRGRRKARPS